MASAYKGTNRIKQSGTPVILHLGERVLNAAQTRALAKAEKEGRVKLPKGKSAPKKLSKAQAARQLRMYVNGTKPGPK